MRKVTISVFVAITIMAVSCKKDLKQGETAAVKAANGWWVTFTLGGADVYGIGTQFLTTYNTAANDDSIWIDDLHNTWDFKAKAKIDFNALTFSTTSSQNQAYDIQVTITDGKILPKAGRSKSGVAVDSIYFKAVFSDDPTDTYEIAGTARTGLIEDDY